jgi:hypothetical protein
MKIMIIMLCIISLFGCNKSNTSGSTKLVPRNGLVGEWLFSGNADDTSGKGNNGIVSGTVLTKDRFQSNDSAYYFNGRNNYIKCGNSPTYVINIYKNATLNIWINFPVVPTDGSGTYGFFICKTDRDEGGKAIWDFDYGYFNPILKYPNLSFYMLDLEYPTEWLRSDNFVPEAHKWYMFTMTKENNSYNFYCNGENIGNEICSRAIPAIKNNYILFGSQANGYYLKGIMDDVRIYDRALNINEIQALYHENGWK